MARTIEYAGEYELSEIKLYTSTGQVIDLSNTTIEINLFEDLLRASISGSVIVADTNNIIQNATILGQEFLTLKIKTPGLDDEAIDYTEHSFCAYKIGSRTDLAQGAEVFEISLVSPELFRSVRTRISKSYTESIDKIVEDILRNPLYCNSKKQLFIEPTSGIRRLVIPNKNPFNIIKVVDENLRPGFPNDTPKMLRQLIKRCWSDCYTLFSIIAFNRCKSISSINGS